MYLSSSLAPLRGIEKLIYDSTLFSKPNEYTPGKQINRSYSPSSSDLICIFYLWLVALFLISKYCASGKENIICIKSRKLQIFKMRSFSFKFHMPFNFIVSLQFYMILMKAHYHIHMYNSKNYSQLYRFKHMQLFSIYHFMY